MKNIILLILLQFSINGFNQNKERADEIVSEGIYLHDKGNYTGAIAKYDEALKVDANNFLALSEKAFTYYTIGRYQDAVDLCSKAIELHSEEEDLTMTYINWGNSLDALKKPESAIEVYEEGIARYPESYLLCFNIGITYIGLEDFPSALEYFHKSAALNPEHASSHNAICRLLYGENNIPSLLSLLRYFAIEPAGTRAEVNLELLNNILFGNVQKTGKNTISISMGGDLFKDSTEASVIEPNDFSSLELAFTLGVAMSLSLEGKKVNDADRLNSILKSLCSMLEKEKPKNAGFYWDYYAPYFIEMNKEGHTLAFSYIVYTASGEKAIKKWQEKNLSLVLKFYKWNDKYVWYKS